LPYIFLQIGLLFWERLVKLNQLGEGATQSFENDEELSQIIEGCKKKIRTLQKKLYEKYFGKMMSIARRYIPDNELALEVLNNGFLKIFNNIDQYKGTGSFVGWMSRIVTNAALDYIRTNKKYEEHFILKEEITSDESVLIDEEEVEDIDINKIYQIIDKLPNMCKAVFNMYVMDGYSHKEIGEALNISIGTSKAHLSAARKKIKYMLTTAKKADDR